MMKKNLYVISGVTGMTGSELARQLLARGEAVFGFDNFFASSIDTVCDILDDTNFVFCEYNITNIDEMRRIAEYVRVHKSMYQRIIYINCAAVVHTEYFYRINETFDTNVTAMKLFLEQAIRCGAAQFINCSTSEIYSMHSFNGEEGVRETDYALLATAEHSQRTSYAAGKLITEFFTKDAVMNGRIQGCSLRFANVYSRNERFSKHIIPHIIQSLYTGGEVELLENSRINRRTFLHNYDSCAAVLALSDTENALDGGIYNVATDEEVSIIELVHVIAEKLNVKNPRIVFKGVRSADPVRRLLNTEKIRRVTNWSPVVSLSAGLDMCIAHIRGEHE